MSQASINGLSGRNVHGSIIGLMSLKIVKLAETVDEHEIHLFDHSTYFVHLFPGRVLVSLTIISS